jgi:hypothetical protein
MLFARIALAALVVGGLASCGGSRSATPTSPDVVAPAFPAARWVPASPSYVFAAPTFADAQRGIRDVVDGLGIFVGLTAEGLGSDLSRMLAVNPLDEAAVGSIGIDVRGGVVAFSEDLAPTFVARVNEPAMLQAFLDKQRERGLVSRSVIVDGVEVFTAEIIRGELDASWAVADGWLWLHFTPAFAKHEGTAWFTNSRKPQNTDWGRDWGWAQGVAGTAKGLVGFVNPTDVIGRFVAKVPEALACARLLEPVQRVGLAVEIEAPGSAKGKVTLDLGASAAQVARATRPVPDGFASVAANSPIVAQWNLDLVALNTWLEPCLTAIGERTDTQRILERYGIRAGRAIVQRIDLDDKSGAGVVSLDLVHKRYLGGLLDDVPMRSTVERDKKFGPIAGKTISIPFIATVDYVLQDNMAYAAMGDGVLARTVGNGTGVPGPLAAIDLFPPMLSVETWKGLLDLAGMPESIAERMLRWREAHISIAIEGSSLVVAASGTRR